MYFFVQYDYIISITYLKVKYFFVSIVKMFFVPSLQLTITFYHILVIKSIVFLKFFSFLLEYTTYILFFSFKILILSPFVSVFLWYNVISRIVLKQMFGGIVWQQYNCSYILYKTYNNTYVRYNSITYVCLIFIQCRHLFDLLLMVEGTTSIHKFDSISNNTFVR